MGGVASTFSRADLLKAEEKPQILMNKILNYVLTNISEPDVFKMQDPDTCKNFLLMTSDSLHHLFAEINLYPVEKRGKIYFARVSELTQPKRDPALKEHLASTCLSIGYFYVRIVQIFVALALSILDDPNLVGRPGAPFEYRPAGARPKAPGFRGGASGVLDELVNRGILIDDRQGHYIVKRRSTDTSSMELMIRSVSTNKNGGVVVGYKPKSLGSDEKQKTASAFTFRITEGNTIKMIIRDIEYPVSRDSSGRDENLTRLVFGRVVEQRRPTKQESINVQIELSDNYELMRPYNNATSLQSFFRQLMNDLENGRVSTIKGYDRVREEDAPVANYYAPRGVAAAAPIKTSSRVPGLDLGPGLAALTKTRPIAHCIARSMQLLSVDATGGIGTTQICNKGFIGSRGQLPDGEAITSVSGMNALNMLFFVLSRTVDLTPRTSAELELALNTMSKVFEDPPGRSFTGTQLSRSSMGTIKGRQTRKCRGRGPATLKGNDVNVARRGVSSLLSYQGQHVARVDALFKQLFAVGADGTIAFNPNLLARGIPEVERIGAEARTLLVEYYTNCEALYQSTVEQIVDLGAPVASAPAQRPLQGILRQQRY
jgi:hypothetical protein